MDLEFFIDVNGNGACDMDDDIIVDPPPIDLVESCPQELLPAALEMLRILDEGGVIDPPGDGDTDGIVVDQVEEPSPLTPDERAKVSAARKFLEKEIIGFIRNGKWNGKFSQVDQRIGTLIDLLLDIDEANLVLARLCCAHTRIRSNPDVKDLRLSIQTNGGTVPLPADFEGTLTVQLLGKGNAVLPAAQFGHCTLSGLDSVSVTGPAQAAVADEEAMTLSYTVTGRGLVRLDVTVVFKPVEVIVIPGDGDGGGDGDVDTVPPSSVVSGAVDIIGEPLEFKFAKRILIRNK
ncbi:MAG TPA: hypothetical protein VI643_01575 [Planctomycetota bacterium]|nr:hypothetical protein [Planctomycetota bacterium]